jgi:hypothetical protein
MSCASCHRPSRGPLCPDCLARALREPAQAFPPPATLEAYARAELARPWNFGDEPPPF